MEENSYQKRMDSYVEKFRLHLQQHSAMQDEIIDAIISVSKLREYKKGEIFSKQGESCDKWAYNCAGIFNVFITQEDGTLFVMSFLKEDDFMRSRFDISTPCNVTIQALSDSVVLEFKTKVLQDMSLQNAQFGNFLRCLVEKYFVVYSAHMIQIGTKKALDNYLIFKNNFQEDEGRIPQHFIAAYLGITPTQLSRVRRKMSSTPQAQ
jgi:Cyclic nucleotide-binding domain.